MDTEILNAANELDDDQGEEERCSQVTPGVLAELREDLAAWCEVTRSDLGRS